MDRFRRLLAILKVVKPRSSLHVRDQRLTDGLALRKRCPDSTGGAVQELKECAAAARYDMVSLALRGHLPHVGVDVNHQRL
jgi:hypothetical protein